MPTFLDRLMGRTVPEKASTGGTGPGVLAYYNDVPLWSASRNPRRLMKQAQELYHTHPWVHAAEHRVSSTAAGVAWHLEDENGDEVTDESPPELKAIRDLIEKPQANLDPRIKRTTRRSLWQLTLRHEGLCGNGFWYKDQRSGLTGTPAAILYINPARMYPAYDKAGNTQGWKLDADEDGNGGIPIELNEIIQFEYDPPDMGAWGLGIVEANGMKAQLSTFADRHMGTTLSAGGRLQGIVAPKPGETIADWDSFVRDWRNVGEDPYAAKRAIIAKAPIDYTRTSATLQELAVEAIAKMSRDDIFTLWGVPQSQAPVAGPTGLNSGDTKGYDEAILWQGPVHARLEPFRETIQYQLLDEIANAGGPSLQLIIEEPEFDDETPLYERAQKAVDQPLTENERRAILLLDPLPDFGPNNEPLGLAIYRPSTLQLVSSAPDENGEFGDMPEPPDASGPADPGLQEDQADEEALALLDDTTQKASTPKYVFGRLNPKYEGASQTLAQNKKRDPKRYAAGIARIRKSPYYLAARKRNKNLTPEEFRRQWLTASRSGDDAFNAFRRKLIPTARLIRRQKRKAEVDGLRTSMEDRFTPAIQSAVEAFLTEQRASIASRVRKSAAHLTSRPKDTSVWWSPALMDRKLSDALVPHAVKLAETVVSKTKQQFPGKADTFSQTVADAVRNSVGSRITAINQTTRDDVARIIAQGFDDGLSPSEVADLIEGATTFDEARAELIARTETMLTYNESAIRSYGEFGVSEVQAIDGDEDAECAARDGQTYSLEEALSITDHPNGTLDWVPIVKAEIPPDPMVSAIKALTEGQMYLADLSQRPINVTSPDVHVSPTVVNIAPPDVRVDVAPTEVTVNLPEPKPLKRTIERDKRGQITGITDGE